MERESNVIELGAATVETKGRGNDFGDDLGGDAGDGGDFGGSDMA